MNIRGTIDSVSGADHDEEFSFCLSYQAVSNYRKLRSKYQIIWNYITHYAGLVYTFVCKTLHIILYTVYMLLYAKLRFYRTRIIYKKKFIFLFLVQLNIQTQNLLQILI